MAFRVRLPQDLPSWFRKKDRNLLSPNIIFFGQLRNEARHISLIYAESVQKVDRSAHFNRLVQVTRGGRSPFFKTLALRHPTLSHHLVERLPVHEGNLALVQWKCSVKPTRPYPACAEALSVTGVFQFYRAIMFRLMRRTEKFV